MRVGKIEVNRCFALLFNFSCLRAELYFFSIQLPRLHPAPREPGVGARSDSGSMQGVEPLLVIVTSLQTHGKTHGKMSVPPTNFVSSLMGSIDAMYYAARLIPSIGDTNIRPLFFSKGWGTNLKATMLEFEDQLNQIDAGQRPSLLPVGAIAYNNVVPWDKPEEDLSFWDRFTTSIDPFATLQVSEVTFISPYAHRLHPQTRIGRFLAVEPKGKEWSKYLQQGLPEDIAGPDSIIFLLPATGEQVVFVRMQQAVALSDTNSLIVIVDAPYYASRKPNDQRGHYCNTVVDYLAQSIGISTETALIAEDLISKLRPTRVVVSGFSWGGAMTGFSTFLLSTITKCPIYSVPYVGSATPAVLVDGILEGDIDFAALERDRDAIKDLKIVHGSVLNVEQAPLEDEADLAKDLHVEKSDIKQELLQVFLTQHSRRIHNILMKTDHRIAACVSSGCISDWFVKPIWVEELHEHLTDLCVEKNLCRLTWRQGGHATAFLWRGSWQNDDIRHVLGQPNVPRAAAGEDDAEQQPTNHKTF